MVIWKWVNSNVYIQIILMLIYSGVRISEFLDLLKENVNLDEKWFDIIDSKTSAGIRRVPIAEKTFEFFKYWMDKNCCKYLLCTPQKVSILNILIIMIVIGSLSLNRWIWTIHLIVQGIHVYRY